MAGSNASNPGFYCVPMSGHGEAGGSGQAHPTVEPQVVPAPRVATTPLDRIIDDLLGDGGGRVAALSAVLAGVVAGPVNAVRVSDEEFPRLAHDGGLPAALAAVRRVLRPGGLLVAAVPELSGLRRLRAAAPPPRVVRHGDDREVIVQLWDWAGDGESYGLEIVQLIRRRDLWELGRVVSTRHRVLTPQEVSSWLADAGFHDVRRLAPQDTRHRVPIWVAVNPPSSSMDGPW